MEASVHNLVVQDKSIVLDGQDISKYVNGVDVQLRATGQSEVALHLARPDTDLDVSADVVYAVYPESDESVMRRAAVYLRTLNPDEIETAALEGLGYGDGNMTVRIMETIAEVFEDAANQLASASDVSGGADAGRDSDHEADLDGDDGTVG